MAQYSIELAAVIFLGLVFGSFASALSWRVPRQISWSGIGVRSQMRSACPQCNHILALPDLIPVFSWLFAGGKCRYCGKKIPVRYPAIELSTLAACLGVYMVWGFTVPSFLIMTAIPFLVALFVIDFDFMILPDQLILIAAILALALIIWQTLAYDPVLGFGQQALLKLAGMLIYAAMIWVTGRFVSFLRKKDALGMGDVKFFAMAGLWLGLAYLPFFLIASGCFGVLTGLYSKVVHKNERFPFGPALILALYAGLLLQGLEIVPLIGVR